MHYVCNAVFLLPILYSCRTQFDGNDLKIVVHFVTFPLTAILREIDKNLQKITFVLHTVLVAKQLNFQD